MRLLTAVFFALCAFSGQAQNKGQLTLNIPAPIERLQEDYKQEKSNQDYLTGYRVQIYNGRKDQCMKQRSTFLNNYPKVATYTVYESPEYRIQVGDFRTRLEAERFRKTILENFSGSFVLKTKIKWPSLEVAIEQNE